MARLEQSTLFLSFVCITDVLRQYKDLLSDDPLRSPCLRGHLISDGNVYMLFTDLIE